jgi:hypothetical protein
MGQHGGVERSVLTFEFLLVGGQSTERWRDQLDDEPGEAIPSEGGSWALPAHKLSQLATEEHHVKDWLEYIDVEGG